jgi:hypothetical protein
MSCAVCPGISNVSPDGLHQPVFCRDLTREGGAPMVTMMRDIAGIHSTRVGSVLSAVSLHPSAGWRQIPALPVFSKNKGIRPTDNSTRVSEVERRPT